MTAHQVGTLMLGLAAIIVLARLLGTVAKRLGQPPVVGEIVAGILVGPTLFGTLVSDLLFPKSIGPALSGLANIGLVLFMFIVGYELDYGLVRGKQKVAVSVSGGSVVLPFGLGVLLALWLARNHGVERVLPFALFLGAAMSVTAFPVLARILTDRGMHRIPVGGLALASAAVDDVIAWSLLAVAVTVGGAGTDQWHVLFAIPYVLVMFFGVRPLLGRLTTMYRRAGRLTPDILAAILVGLLLSCYAAEWLGVHVIFGAFLFGVVMAGTGEPALRHAILERLEQLSVLLLLPVFFFIAGMRVNLSTVDIRGFVELALILAVAIIGKFAGAFLGARLQRLPGRQAGALATLMNTRGLTEIVILTVGLELGILDSALFSLMVVMALVTTVMAGPLLSLIYPRRLVERDLAAAERASLGRPDAYRVVVVVDRPATDDGPVRLGVDLASAAPRPAEVVLSHLVPYQTPGRLEVGAGLSGELQEVSKAMGELYTLAGQVGERGLAVSVLTRLAVDAPRELAAQLDAVAPSLVVVSAAHPGHAGVRQAAGPRLVTLVGPLPASWEVVTVRLNGGDHTDAALQVGAQLAAASGATLVVDTTGRWTRRANIIVGELTRHGLKARVGSPTPGANLLVATDGGQVEGAHLVVRVERDAEPVDWAKWPPIPQAAPPEEAATVDAR